MLIKRRVHYQCIVYFKILFGRSSGSSYDEVAKHCTSLFYIVKLSSI